MSRPCSECKYKSNNPYLRYSICYAPAVREFDIISGYTEPECMTIRDKNRSYVGGNEGFVYGECQHFKPTLIARLIDLIG